MLRRGGSCQASHAALRQIAEKHLGRGAAVFSRCYCHSWRDEDLRIGGQGPETLINNVFAAAKSPEHPVIMRLSVKAVLQRRRFYPGGAPQALEPFRLVAIADAQLADKALVEKALHGAPGLERVAVLGIGRVQDEAVEGVHAKIAQRDRKRLLDLLIYAGAGIIGDVVRVLPSQGRKFGLQKNVRTQHPFAGDHGQRLAHAGLVIMFGLAGGVYAAKACAQGLGDQFRRALLFLRCSVNQLGHGDAGGGEDMALIRDSSCHPKSSQAGPAKTVSTPV